MFDAESGPWRSFQAFFFLFFIIQLVFRGRELRTVALTLLVKGVLLLPTMPPSLPILVLLVPPLPLLFLEAAKLWKYFIHCVAAISWVTLILNVVVPLAPAIRVVDRTFPVSVIIASVVFFLTPSFETSFQTFTNGLHCWNKGMRKDCSTILSSVSSERLFFLADNPPTFFFLLTYSGHLLLPFVVIVVVVV